MSRGIAIYAALVAGAAILFTAFPHVDLWAAGLFFDGKFHDNEVFHFVFRAVYWLTDALFLLPLAVLIAILICRRNLFGLDRLGATFLIVALLLGPGVAVNSALKDHWGRARPSQVTEFGGAKQFTPALEPTDQCGRNCSFPAGHPSIGFYFLSFALLIPAAWPRRMVFGGGLLAGALLGLMRMAQGAHFLSDVVFSGLVVFGVSWLAHELIVRRGGLGALHGWRKLAGIGAVCLFVGACSYFFYDRPIAVAMHGMGQRTLAVAAFITQFGYSRGYLVISAVVAIGLYFLGRRWRRWAWRAAFIFLNVALSGILVDIVKAIVGRPRPKLFFADGAYGFEWFRWGSDHWSFPSGHAQTAAAVALSLSTIWPRWWPAWWLAALLVMASRIVLDAHYLSDQIGGFFAAFVVWWFLRDWFDRKTWLGMRSGQTEAPSHPSDR